MRSVWQTIYEETSAGQSLQTTHVGTTTALSALRSSILAFESVAQSYLHPYWRKAVRMHDLWKTFSSTSAPILIHF